MRLHNVLGGYGTDAAALAKLRVLKVEEIVDGGQESDGLSDHF